MAVTSSLTATRRRGLAALLVAEGSERPARRSNTTLVAHGYVYWQTADWLIAAGFAVLDGRAGDGDHLRLTVEGRALAEREGLTS